MKKLMLAVMAGFMLAACGQVEQARAPSATIEYKFASIAAGHMLDGNEPSIARAKDLLEKASVKFATSENEISDGILSIKGIADQEKIQFDMYAVLEGIPAIEARNISNPERFHKLLAYYMNARHNGMNHSDALIGLSEIVSVSEKSK